MRGRLSNVAVVTEDEPPPGLPLLGLYEGIPLTRRTTNYSGVLPDKITIFRGPSNASTGPTRRSSGDRSSGSCCTRSRTTSGSATSGWSSSTATRSSSTSPAAALRRAQPGSGAPSSVNAGAVYTWPGVPPIASSCTGESPVTIFRVTPGPTRANTPGTS